MLLGRNAASLFWLARYMERAENTARLVEVAYRISLMPRPFEGHRDEWRSTIVSAECTEGFFAKYAVASAETVINYLLFDRDNPASVRSCLDTARRNGRAVRTALTRDVWESLNSTWNELAQIKPAQVKADTLPGFLDWIKQRSMLFRGALLGTALRQESFYFSQLGSFIERADSTARILDVKYHILLPRSEGVGSAIDTQQWITLLRSVSAHRAYRWAYRDSDYEAWNIAEFLILDQRMPRSLSFCYDWVVESLDSLEELHRETPACIELARATRNDIRGKSISDIFSTGLHEFLEDFLAANNKLSSEIASAYNFS